MSIKNYFLKPLHFIGACCLFGILGLGTAQAQVAMTRSTFTGTYTAVSGAATSITGGDDVTNSFPLPFNFSYLGTNYVATTNFLSVCSNGFAFFSTTNVTTPTTNSNLDLYGTSTPRAMAPWWDDMNTAVVGTNPAGYMKYETSGSSPSRVLTVEWQVSSYFSASVGQPKVLNFQIKLYETTNVIEFWYGSTTGSGIGGSTSSSQESASIGIKDATGGNNHYIDAVTGSSFTGNYYLTSNQWPKYNFRFTPGAPTTIAAGTYNVGVGQTYRNLSDAIADLNHRGVSGAVTMNLTDAAYDSSAANGSNFFPMLLGPIAGVSAANTVTISKTGSPAIISWGGAVGASGGLANQASTSALSSSTDPIIGLVGADRVTLNNLDIRGNVNALLSDYGLAVLNSSATDGAQNNTLQNISITMNRANTGSRGILQNVVTTPTSAAGANSNNKYLNLTIKNVYGGILLTGNSSFPDLATEIGNTVPTNFNAIGDPSTANDIGNGSTQTSGIRATSQSGFKFYNNEISNITVTSSVNANGIYIENSQGASTTYNNKIHDIKTTSTSTSSILYGIRSDVNSASSNSIYNNFIYNFSHGITTASATMVVRGIGCNIGSNTGIENIYHNSISVNVTSAATSAALYTQSGTTVSRNNILLNLSSGVATSKRYAVFFSSGSLTSNNNDLYVTAGTNTFIGGNSTTDYAALANWQGSAGTPDLASFSTNPNFVSATDLHLNYGVSGNQFESAGASTGVTGILTDIDNQSRPGPAGSVNGGGTAPDIGADEFDGVSQDLTPPSITYTPLSNTCNVGGQFLTATITDASGVPTSGAGLPVAYWKINAGSYQSSQGTYQGSNQYQFVLGLSANSGDVVTYYIVAQDNATTPNISVSPSGGASGLTANPPAASTPPTTPNTYTHLIYLTGTYTVGSGGNYPTLTAAVNAYNNSCLNGAVVFNLIDLNYSGSETFPIVIAANPQANINNTLKIKPANPGTVITGSVASGALIKLNGADYITFDGSTSGGTDKSLTITNTNATAPTAISLISLGTGAGADGNTIKNCLISTNSTSTSTTYGIAIGGATPGTSGADNDNTIIQNNTITGASVGIYGYGTVSVSAGGSDNLWIFGNTITINTTVSSTYGMQLGYQLNCLCSLNTLDVFTTSTTAPVGISIETGCLASQFTRNNITNVSTTATNGYGGRGIAVGTGSTSSSILIANNFISGVNGCSWTSFGNSASMGIALGMIGNSSTISTTTGGISVLYNSVNMYGNQPAGGYAGSSLTASFYVGSGVSNIFVNDNIFTNTQNNPNASGTGTKNYAIYSAAANSAFSQIANNDYYVSGTQGVLGNIGSTDRTTLAAIVTGFGQNSGSVNIAPVFTSNSDLHLVAASNSSLDGAAQANSITIDYDGTTRNATTPDIGADEFVVPGCAGAAGGTATGSSSFCGSGTPTITATGYSTGTGSTYQWVSSSSAVNYPAGGTNVAGQTNPASLTTGVVNATTYYWLVVTCTTGVATAYSNMITITVNPSVASVNPSSISICTGQSTTLTENGGTGTSWSWSPGGATTQAITVSPTTTTTYTVTVTSPGPCTATATSTVTVNPLPTGVTATASPNPVCTGSNLNLTSTYTSLGSSGMSQYVAARTTGTGYTSIIPATTITSWRNTSTSSSGGMTDDNLSDNQPIGFNFSYNGNAYSTFRVSTNGFLTFDNSSTSIGNGASNPYSYTNSWTVTGGGLVVAPNWDDLQTAGNLASLADLNNSINYTTTGSVGNRILTVEWKNMQDFNSTSTASYNWQVKLYESDMHIEFVYGTMTQSAASISYSLGLSAATVSSTPTAAELLSQTTVNTGSFGFTNQTSLNPVPASNTTITFTPPTPAYSWSGPNSFSSTVANPTISGVTAAAAGVYQVQVTNTITGCSATASTANVTVNSAPVIGACPSNITSCNAVVTYSTPSATGTPSATVSCAPASGSTFATGTTTVTCTATNTCGTSTCTFAVTINSSPVIAACPADITQCDNHTVTYSTPAATGSPAATVSCVPASGSTFATGTTTVTCTATNTCGSSTCSFSVTINESPVIGACPSDITQCDNHIVTYTTPSATGSPAATVTCSPASGTSFAAGMTMVTCNASNSCGSSSCAFNVLINESPVISACPMNITQCGAGPVTWIDPTATGTPSASVQCFPNSGSSFIPGTTTVTCSATNSCGTSSCSFTVTINEAPVIAPCPGPYTQCDNHVVFFPTPPASGTPAATVTCVPASGSTFPTGTSTVTCTATNSCGSNFCAFSVTINETPQISACPADIDLCNTNIATWTDPTATSGTPAGTVTCMPPSGSSFPSGTTTVTCSASNPCGSTSCSFNVNVSSITCQNGGTVNQFCGCNCPSGYSGQFCEIANCVPPVIGACPADISLCNTNIATWTDPSATGTTPTVVCTPSSGSTFASGTTAVTCTATNGCGSSSCSFSVTVNTSPTISACPSDITQCDNHVVTYTGPTANGTPVPTLGCVPASGSTFATGTTTVTCTATNTCGSVSCSFNVTINETPVIGACPNDITVCDNHNPTYSTPSASGLPAATVTCVPQSGATFNFGTTTVTCTATNTCGSSSCSFTVTVNGSPVIGACPSDITICNNHNPVYTTPFSSGFPAATVTCSPASGSTFATGTTAVTCTASNVCGSSTCSFNVTVNESPVIGACPSDITQCDNHVVTYTAPTATASPAANVICIPASGSNFATGATTVQCTATNSCGASSCSFTVTINESPVIGACPADITTSNPVVTYSTPSATGTPTPTVSCAPASGSTFASGTTVVTCTASNSCGSSTCSFNVTVTGGCVPPVIGACPADIYTCNATVTYTTPTATGTSPVVTCVPASGSTFPGGTTAVTCTATNGCGSSSCSFNVVRSLAPPAGTVHYTTVFTDGCVSAPAQPLAVNAVSGATFYRWTSGQAGVRFNGNPSPYETTVPNVNVTFVSLPAAGASGWSICVFAGNACGNTNTICTWVRATVSMPSSITGGVIGCPGSGGNAYSVSAVAGAASYMWSATGGMVITGNGNQNITVAFPAGFVSGVLSVHGQTSCGYNGPDRNITITANPAIPGIITGSSYPCPSASASYSIATVPGAVSYTWTTSVPGALVTGTSTSCSILFPAVIPAGSTVSVVANSSCPTSSPVRSKGIASGVPSVPQSISGPASGQCGQTGVSYSISPVALATSYSWTASCGTIVGPTNLSAITVDWPASFTVCTLTVTASNACGVSIPRTLGVTGAPGLPAVITGNAAPCANTAEMYTTTGSSGATSYIWTVPAGAVILGPSNGNSILVQWGASSGNITVRASNACGNSAVRSFTGTISCRLNQVNAASGAFSAEVYPNPATEKATVKFNSSTAADYTLILTDVIGQQVLTSNGHANEGVNMIELNVGAVAKGVYMLTIISNGSTEQIRLAVE